MGMTPVRVGVIGAGNMAREHIRAFNALPNATVTGIQSRTRKKAEALADELAVPMVTDTLQELVASCTPDVLVITVNMQHMLEVALQAADLPCTVLLEKPAGANLVEAQRLLTAAEAGAATMYVGLNRRFMSATEHALQGIGEEARFIHVQDQQSMAAALAYGHPAVVVDNWMYANSIHLIDYLSLFGRGDVIEVNNLHEWQGIDTRLMLSHIRFSSGDEGLYEGIWQGPGPWAATVTSAAQRWDMRPLEKLSLQQTGSRELTQFDLSPADSEYKPGFVRQAEDVVRAHRGESNRAVTLQESLATMDLIARIFTPS